jgi:tryptophan synthase alpha chain
MNRIAKTFFQLKHKDEKALVGFVTAGDPDLETSLEIILTMCRSGLDILELGIPFSDPTADGPVIQRSSARALTAGMTVKAAFDLTRKIRQEVQLPIILFSYYNPIFIYGGKRFYEDALKAGADGLLVVDLPPEESDELVDAWPGRELSLIRLVAPTTPQERMTVIEKSGDGFLYLISKTGITGSDGLHPAEIKSQADTLRSVTNLPVCVGFGISTPKDVAAVSAIADGVVIGSAFERTIESNLNHKELPGLLSRQTATLKAATRKRDKL